MELPCLCEFGGSTSSEYETVHGPALMQKATEATAVVNENMTGTFIRALICGSLPALFVVLFIEGFHVRWQQRVAPSTPNEAKLQATVMRGLRRRMAQIGVSLWIGGVLFALSVPARVMFGDGSWPNDGAGWWPYGMPIFWDMLREPVSHADAA